MNEGSVTIRNIYAHAITGSVCAALAFGFSQIWAVDHTIRPVAEQVRSNAESIVRINEEQKETKEALRAEHADFTARIVSVSSLITSVMDNQKELLIYLRTGRDNKP